ncbi:hypothetical protein Dimus_009122 [Dionaea muscipula]
MAHQEEGWPLGLPPLNVGIGLERARDYRGPLSFNTILTCSPTSSTASTSDLDTESTGSFFHDRSVTLGSLIGASSILELAGRSVRGRRPEPLKAKRPCKSKAWCLSLCSRNSTDAMDIDNAPSPAVDNNASSNDSKRNRSSIADHGANEISLVQPMAEANTLFVNGQIAPPRCSSSEAESCRSGANVHGLLPALFSFVCGQTSL